MFLIGMIMLVYIVIDYYGNIDVCIFDIIVVDNEVLVVICLLDMVWLDVFGNGSIILVVFNGGVFDNCLFGNGFGGFVLLSVD